MIQSTVESVLAEHDIKRGVKVVISVPNGEEIAKKTLNARLGIIGGISILGTRGIVVPFSTASYKASIAYAINVAREQGIRTVVLTTGGRSEKYAMELFPDLPIEAFVQIGDFVGFSAKQAKRAGMKEIRFVGMMGKFSKVAQGVMMVHTKSAPARSKPFLHLTRVPFWLNCLGTGVSPLKRYCRTDVCLPKRLRCKSSLQEFSMEEWMLSFL
jgi:cobalt-precorrin-5B (C1)-methyltransferase